MLASPALPPASWGASRPPCRCLQDAAAAKRGGGRGAGHFERKELRLAVVPADGRSRPAGAPLGTVALNLADFVSPDNRTMQQAFTVTPARGRSLGGAKLLLTIG